MIRHESKLGLLFRHWFRANPGLPSATYELKDSRLREVLYLSEISPIQLDAASAASGDQGYLVRVQSGTVGAPDYIGLCGVKAYIVIGWPGRFDLIEADILQDLKDKKAHLLTMEESKKLCKISVETSFRQLSPASIRRKHRQRL